MAKETELFNSYDLSRNWFDWTFENTEIVTPNHTALYFFIIEHCNRMGWKKKFGLPSGMAKDAIGMKTYKTYIKTFNDLVDWGFIELVEKSKNQYSSNIVALVKMTKATTKALTKASLKHRPKQSQSTDQSKDSIDNTNNLITNKPNNLITNTASLFVKSDLALLVDSLNEKLGKHCRVTPKLVKLYEGVKKENYTDADILTACDNAMQSQFHIENKYTHLCPEFFLRFDKLEKWLNANSTIIPIKTTITAKDQRDSPVGSAILQSMQIAANKQGGSIL